MRVPRTTGRRRLRMSAVALALVLPLVGGATTTFGVHIEYASGHGFTPVAVSFNCWINRRTRARIYNSGVVERIE